MYDSDLGMFYAMDPAGQGYSPLAYAGNNPVIRVDRDGKFFIPLLLGLAEAASYAYTAFNIIDGFAAGGVEGGLMAFAGSTVGFVTGGLGNAITGGIMQNVYGIVPGMLVGAGVKGTLSGLQSLAFSGNFWDGFTGGAVLGGLSGGIQGYMNASNSIFDRNLLWGNKTGGSSSGLLASSNLGSTYSNINRPDNDGYLTLSEANEWYREGGGKDLYADLSKIDLSKIKPSDFNGILSGQGKYFSLLMDSRYFSSLNDGLVYNSIGLRMEMGELFSLKGFDVYDFEMHEWGPKTFFRNIGTWVGKLFAGDGSPYKINFYNSYKMRFGANGGW